MKRSFYLDYCYKNGVLPIFNHGDRNALLKKIRESDFFIADDKCTHRIIGLYFKIGVQNSKVSAVLFHNYVDGQEIHPKDYHCIVHYYANFFYRYNYRKKRSR